MALYTADASSIHTRTFIHYKTSNQIHLTYFHGPLSATS